MVVAVFAKPLSDPPHYGKGPVAAARSKQAAAASASRGKAAQDGQPLRSPRGAERSIAGPRPSPGPRLEGVLTADGRMRQPEG